MWDFLLIILVTFVIGTFLYIQHITVNDVYTVGRQNGGNGSDGSSNDNAEESHKYLYLAQSELKAMFDHQVPYKTKNGSWLSVDFANMKLFDKDNIWRTLIKKLSEEEAARLHPRTFYLPQDLPILMALAENTFILKKTHMWGRQGLLIVDNKRELLDNSKLYDIAQVLIPNPDLINSYKYDIRMFLVVHYQHGILLYKQSYMSYSNKPYDYNSKDMFARIGGIHLTPEFYASNNLPTSSDKLKKYPQLYPKITKMLQRIFQCYPTPLLSREEVDRKLIKVFGIDINIFKEVDGSDRPMLIEMNSNPCLLFPEAEWKNKLIYDMTLRIKDSALDYFTKIRDI